MSHIAEVYAKDLGVKVGKPHIQDHFYPILSKKYITLHTDTEIQSKQYDHWDLCMSMLIPYLKPLRIKIVQVSGPKSRRIMGVDELVSNGSFRNTNYIIKKSLLHLGIDSLPVHVASVYDKPIVALYSHTYKETCYPYWSDSQKVKLLSPDFTKLKPSFSTNEHPKRINEIKPEDVVRSVLDKLEIKAQPNFNTVFMGKDYTNQTVEIIPNFYGFTNQLTQHNLTIRADLHYNEEYIQRWTSRNAVSLMLSQPYPIELFNSNIKQVVFLIDETKDSEDLNKYFKIIKRKNIKLIILTKKKDTKDLRYKYFDYEVRTMQDPKDMSDLVNEKTKFLTSKVVLSNGEQYKSIFSAKMLDKSGKFILNDHSKEELESLYLYE